MEHPSDVPPHEKRSPDEVAVLQWIAETRLPSEPQTIYGRDNRVYQVRKREWGMKDTRSSLELTDTSPETWHIQATMRSSRENILYRLESDGVFMVFRSNDDSPEPLPQSGDWQDFIRFIESLKTTAELQAKVQSPFSLLLSRYFKRSH